MRPHSRGRRAASGLWLLCALAPPLAAQGAGASVTGTVIDAESREPIASAVVTLRGTLLSTRTGDAGRFRLSGAPPGRYTLRVLAIGYAADSLVDLTLAPGEQREVSLALRPSPVGLADVVITANRTPERAEESGASVNVLPASVITNRNVTTLDQALTYVPGVTFNAGEMDIRGSTGLARGVGSRVLLLLDGHPILSGDGGEIDFESLPLLDVSRVEVVKGAYSALYGSNALGGVVNVITAPVPESPRTLVRAHYGVWQIPDRYRYTNEALDEKGVGVQHSRRVGNLGTLFYLGREMSDGYRQDDRKSRWLGRVKLASPTGSGHPWDAYAVWAREIDGEFFTWRSDSEPFQVQDSTANDHELDYKLLTGATLTPVLGPRAVLRVSPYLNYNSVQNFFHDNSDHHRATRVGGTVDLSLRPGGHHALDIGGDAAHTIVASNFLGTHYINDDALFWQDQVGLSQRWSLALGARLDYHDVTGTRPEWSPNPKLGIIFHPAAAVSLRASVGRGYRAPSAIEQFVNTTQFGVRVIPNLDLRGERAWSEEIGITTTPWPRLRLDGSVFQSQYRDLIGPTLAPGQLTVAQFRNLTRARIRGVDVGVRSRLWSDILGVEANYMLLDTRDETGAPLPYRSRHNFTGSLQALGGLVDVDVRFRSRVQQVLQYFTDPRKSFTVVDLRLAYRIAGIAVQAKVSNLFQTFYVDVQERNPGAPRNVSLTAYRAF